MANKPMSIQGLKAAMPAEPQMGTNAPKSGTPPGSVAAYMPPSEGPFSCDNCEYYIDPNNCSKPEVLQELGDATGSGYASVEPKGCCNFYEKK